MGTAKRFEELRVWQAAREMTREIYTLTGQPTFSRDSNLRDQMRRAAVSAMSNIAEGFERAGNKELRQFLTLAKASSGELRSHLYVALDQKYVSKDKVQETMLSAETLSRSLGRFMQYLRESTITGTKYRSQVREP